MSLPVSRLVRVSINLSPLSASTRSFGVLMIAGSSNVINGLERYRSYDTIEGVALDFGTTAPEYKAAALYFGQSPKPKTCMIARWLQTASAAQNLGGILSSAQQVMTNWTSITSGGFQITIDGVAKSLTGLDFSAAANLNAVAAIIDTALTGATVVWNGAQFIVTSATTGVSSAVTYATAPVSGTDISAQLKLTASTSIALIPGYAAEEPVACVAALANMSAAWYGIMFAATTMPSDSQDVAVADFVEALDLTRIFGVTITDTSVLSALVSSDLASVFQAAGYKQSFVQYSENAYAIASFFGRAFSVNFNGNRTTITLMYKQEPSVTPQDLTTSQADVLKSKRCNVFVKYVNDTSIIQYGTMSGPAWFDEIHGLDWFQDAVQTACYNLLYTSTTKIPQTDAGVNQFVNAIAAACDQGVQNGLIAPGTWNADGFGQLARGQFLKEGYYIYAQPIALQAQSDRDLRVAPPIQVAIKLAGAIQELDILVNVNR